MRRPETFPRSARRASICAVLALGIGTAAAQPVTPAPSEFRISGFGTVGIAHIDGPDGWAFKRDGTQPDNRHATRADLDSRLGLQLNYAPMREFELVAQVVATRRTAAARSGDAIEWAFAAWRPDADWTVRGGRMNLDAFLLSDYRHVGFAYPFIRPPVDVYAQLPGSFDGIDVARSWNTAGGLWRAKVYAGRSATFSDASTRLSLEPSYGAVVSREADGLLLRASAARTRFNSGIGSVQQLLDALGPLAALPIPDVAAQAADFRSKLSLDDVNLNYISLGARYEAGLWLASSEYTRTSGQPLVAYSSAYASVGRRFGALTAVAAASRVKSSNPPAAAPNWGAALTPVLGPAGAAQAQFLADSAATVVNTFRVAQSTWSLGARYDLDARYAVKVQWDRIRVDANGGRLWGGDRTFGAADANVTSVAVDFVF